jgi:ABC-2 type transport system ATP-binding protein
MKVRLAFAVVSQLDEPTLLVDEVLAVGDKAFREKCYRRIDELLAEGRTLLRQPQREGPAPLLHARPLPRQGRAAAGCPDREVLAAYNADYNS